jgi:phosphoglycolate phosphatase
MKPAVDHIGAIAFDLDGTLIDSAPDIQHALNVALDKARLASFDLGTVRGWIGDGPDALIARALARSGADLADVGLHARLRRWFDEDTLAAPLSLGSVFPGVHELVESLQQRLPLVVVTNKPTPLARAVLEAAGLHSFMVGVYGGDRPALRKPAPDLLLQAAADLGIAPSRLLMTGDSTLDVRAAHAAGCPAALVSWGYDGHSLSEGLCAWRVESPADLLAHLQTGDRIKLH